MSEYTVSSVLTKDKRSWTQIEALLNEEGLKRDDSLDYTCAMYDDDYNVIGTGSCYKNTLRCFAVSKMHQGEGLLNEIISHLIQIQNDRGYSDLFLYTKPSTAKFFSDLGFYEIARVTDTLVFMENKRNGFQKYLDNLKKESGEMLPASAIVMNANPFTLGHKYLVEIAAQNSKLVHIFVVSEESSLVPFCIRKELVQKGCSGYQNVIIHSSGPYIISSATFPSYFIKSEDDVIKAQAILDATVFSRIAKTLNINTRFVGDEPFSRVTSLYNEVLANQLPQSGINCSILPRKQVNEKAISASTVRQCIKSGKLEELKNYLPQSSLDFFMSADAKDIIDKIQSENNVIHY